MVRLAAALALLVALASPVAASEWREIKPGESTTTDVRARFGAPSREATQKVEGYDTMQWVYEGPSAPAGMLKVTIDFGLKTPTSYNKDVVRTFTLEPKHEVFNRRLVLYGWGPPDRLGKQGDTEFFFYREGLLVYFDKEGEQAITMTFTPPQPLPEVPRPTTPPPR
jgi:hypothetical protein